jgi:hypothetical protein
MVQLNLTDELVNELVRQVAPLVTEATGWSLKLDGMVCRVVPKSLGYEEVVLKRLHDMKMDQCVDGSSNLANRLVEYMVEGSLLAAYMPASQELLVVRENLDDSNLNGLRLVLAHELVHRAQHVTHPELFAQIDHRTQMVFCAYFQSPGSLGLHEFIQALREIQTMMSLVESHAVYIQTMLAKSHFADAHVEPHFSLPVLLFRLLGADKISQYTTGIPAIAEAASAGKMDALFRSPGKFIESSG